MRPTTTERLMSKVIVGKKPTDCWGWTGCINNIGYALFRYEGKMWSAHRVMAVREGIIWDDAQEVHHLCANKACINPQHLCAGTQKQRYDKMHKQRKCKSNA